MEASTSPPSVENSSDPVCRASCSQRSGCSHASWAQGRGWSDGPRSPTVFAVGLRHAPRVRAGFPGNATIRWSVGPSPASTGSSRGRLRGRLRVARLDVDGTGDHAGGRQRRHGNVSGRVSALAISPRCGAQRRVPDVGRHRRRRRLANRRRDAARPIRNGNGLARGLGTNSIGSLAIDPNDRNRQHHLSSAPARRTRPTTPAPARASIDRPTAAITGRAIRR